MAAKGLKAVCVRGRRAIRPAHPETFTRLLATIDQRVRDHAEYDARTLMGTTKLVHALNQAGCLATHHYQLGRFAAADQVSGEHLAEKYKLKNKGCAACNIPCSRFFAVSDGPQRGLKSEGPEFEGLAGFSSRVGIVDQATALKGVDLCNRLGMDVISVSECISFVMECYEKGYLSTSDCDGLELRFGNAEATLALIERIARREGLGDLLADGVRLAAERIGGAAREIAMHVKGLELFQADPRGLKAYALGNAVASRGGDHLRSEPSFEFSEDDARGEQLYGTADAAYRLRYRGKGRVVKHYEEWSALADCLEVCKNTIVNMEVLDFAGTAELLRAGTGAEWDAQMVQSACERLVNLERLFLVRQGLRRQDDRLPSRFLKEPLGPESGPSAGSVVELEAMLDEYYSARSWDLQTGVPTLAKLRSLGLEDEAKALMADRVPMGDDQ
ncbi:MAG: aldehyde ferredoxin oxidoreductase C-terminal domain-containing protein [Bacillota bacterium]